MLQAHSALRAFLKKYTLSSVLAAAALLVAGNVWAGNREPAVRLLNSVAIPVSAFNTGTGTFSYDIITSTSRTEPTILPIVPISPSTRSLPNRLSNRSSRTTVTGRSPGLHRAHPLPVRMTAPVPTAW
jgi:hypothetical protein